MPIEQYAPEFSKIMSTDQPIPNLTEGYGGENGPAEGPLWWKEGGYLLFSDIQAIGFDISFDPVKMHCSSVAWICQFA